MSNRWRWWWFLLQVAAVGAGVALGIRLYALLTT